MLAERLRFRWLSVLVLAPLAFAPTANPTPSSISMDLPIVEIPTAARIAAPTTPTTPTPDELYRAGDFVNAAHAARAFDANLAELYDQLGFQLAIAATSNNRPDTALPALREAAKLDTVLGGAWTEVIHAQTVDVLPKAANSYVASYDYDAARQAVETADIMGLHTNEIDLVRHKLERAGR